jgi:subtilisin-like proprotein convertase family protein
MRLKSFNKITRLTSLLFVFLTCIVAFALTTRPFTSASAAAPDVVFTNTAPITINTFAPPPTVASPYPSTIAVSGMTGTTSKVTVTLVGITHPNPSELDLLLVSPTGVKFILMSDITSQPANNVTITLDTTAAPILPQNPGTLVNGNSYRPANYFGFDSTDVFPAPAPAPPYLSPFQTGSATLFNFNGFDPNGTWSLYVADDTLGNSGSLSGGWSINVTTTGTAATNFANAGSITITDTPSASAPASPYPSTIEVTGLTGVVTNIKVTLTGLSHTRAEDVDVMVVNPNGAGVILMSDAGTGAASNVTLTFDDAAVNPLPPSGALATGTFKPTNYSSGGAEPNGDAFPPPAPTVLFPPSIPSLKDTLGGYSPNGTWYLYVVDDTGAESGTLAGGWSIDITTAPFTAPTLSCVFPSFTSTGNLAVGSSPTGIAAGDFNNDNKRDLVVTNQGANNVSVLLGDGLGGFGAANNFATATSPYSVAVGQFNADTNLDLVVVNSGSNNVSILLGDGMGGFSAPTNFGVGISPIHVAVADFNNDTKPDLAVANFGGFFAGTVSILLGTGTGTFSPATNYGVRTQPAFVAVGDFNADNNRDLAVANFGSNNLSILMGAGNGTFTPTQSTVNTGSGPVSIAVADFNADSKADLAVAHYNTGTISIFTGVGDGTFTTGAQNISTGGTNPISIISADFNSDAKADLAVVNSGSNNLRVIFGNGTVNFPSSGLSVTTFNVSAGPNALVSDDFNADGKPDLATVNSGSNSATVLLNVCAVAQAPRNDFDEDRRTDLSVFRPSNATWYTLFSTSTSGGFTFTQFGAATDVIVPEDYNGDGKTEIGVFRPSTATWMVPGIYHLPFGLSTDIPVPADYDGDSRADIAVFRPSNGTWYIRLTTNNSMIQIPFGSNGDKPVARDYDGDDKADVAVFRPSTGTWYILQSSDNQVRGVGFGSNGDRPVPADYDGDGEADVAVFRPTDGIWYILRSSDNGFAAFSWGLSTDIPVPGDYEGDGKFDVAVFRPSNGYWYVLRSLDGALFARQWGINGDIPLPSAYVPVP